MSSTSAATSSSASAAIPAPATMATISNPYDDIAALEKAMKSSSCPIKTMNEYIDSATGGTSKVFHQFIAGSALAKINAANAANKANTANKANVASTASTANAVLNLSDDEEMMPWEEDGWVPCSKTGKQHTPNMIRNQLQRYIDECKANRTSTQTEIISKMGVNNNSFRRFMNPKTYKSAWSATENSTYWEGAKLLERVKYEKEQAKKAKKKSVKRKAIDEPSSTAEAKKTKGDTSSPVAPKPTPTATTNAAESVKKTKAQLKQELMELVQRISAVVSVKHQDPVYDTCPQVVAKTKLFLQREGMTKALLLTALGDINSNSMNRFLSGKKQDQCGNVSYKEAYIFFEKLRVLEGKNKTKARLKNESEHPNGFSLVKKRSGSWKFLPLHPSEMMNPNPYF